MSRARGSRAVTRSFAEIPRELVDWLEPGRIALREITLVAGMPGIGKSQWACLLAARLSCGELGEPAGTLYITAEDSPGATIRPRLEAAGSDLTRVHGIQLVRDGYEDALRLPDDVELLDELIASTDARLVVIDPLFNHLSGSVDSYKDQSIRQALGPLKQLAEKHRCAVVVIVHVNPGQSSDAYVRIGGSKSGLQGAARAVFVFARDPDDPGGEHGSQRVLANVKNNLAVEAPSQLYRIEPILLPAGVGEPAQETSRVVQIGLSDCSGRDLLAMPDGEERTLLEEATDWLRDELGAGARTSGDLFRDARRAGHAEKTVRRALKQVADKTKVGNGPGSSWYWFLKPDQVPLRPDGPWPSSNLANGVGQVPDAASQAGSRPSETPKIPNLAKPLELAKFGAEEAVLSEARELVQNGHAEWTEP